MSSPSIRERAVRLMQRVMRDGGSLAQEYPLVFDTAFDGRVLAIEEQGQVRSACAVLTRDCVAGDVRVRVGLIGSVSTEPAYRRRGFASRLLDLARAELARQGCALIALWADEPEFYEARGFVPFGAESDFLIELAHKPSMPRFPGVRAAAGDDVARLHSLYSRHRERFDRRLEETRALLSSPGMETLVLEDRNEIAAYSCLGRGADLARAVHEWAGAPEHVLALLGAHLERSAARKEREPICLIAPTSAVTLRDLLHNRGIAEHRGILGLARIGDAATALELVSRAAAPGTRLSLEEGSEHASVRVRLEGPRSGAELDEQDLVQLIAPARGDASKLRQLEADTGAALPGLPLPLFAWGLDSI